MPVRGNRSPEMSEPPVDPELFRLRAFETSWQDALRSEAEIRAVSEDLLGVLTVETEHWRAIGREIGYFPDRQDWEPRQPDTYIQELYFPESRESQLPDHATFQSMLRVARGDLTPERLAFLDLFVFADEERWDSAVAALMDIGADGQSATQLPLSADQTESLAWSLDGAEPPSNVPGEYAVHKAEANDGGSIFVSPAAWRIELPLNGLRSPMPPERFSRRAAQLSLAREHLRSLAQAAILGDSFPAGLGSFEVVRQPPQSPIRLRFIGDEPPQPQIGWVLIGDEPGVDEPDVDEPAAEKQALELDLEESNPEEPTQEEDA